jgi:hypothetical protein
MRALSALFLLLAITISLTSPARAETPADLQKAIESGVKMLEAKNYLAFIETFMPPEDVAQVPDKARFAEGFGKKKAAVLLEVLRFVQSRAPEMSADGKKATWSLGKMEGAPAKRPLVFLKHDDGRWYIEN